MHDPGRLCLLKVGDGERLLVSGAGGASFYGSAERKHEVLLHVVKRASGRIEIVEVRVINAPEQVSPSVQRTLSLSRIMAALNRPEHRDELHELLADPPKALPDNVGALPVPAIDPALDPSWADAHKRAIEPSSPHRKIRRSPTPRRRPLKVSVPEAKVKPDAFYERIANLYIQESSFTQSPAKAIAEANDVPTKAVHAWVKEARRRRLLEPGTRGRASW